MDVLRSLVSKKKKRYQEEGFDLDLTYISTRIISMGYPSSGAEAIYRNPVDDVKNFFQQKHGEHYKIYNLCSERNYDASVFSNRVARYPFDDHNAPYFNLILPFCEDVTNYLLSESSNNDNNNQQSVAAIHCKAGKGRTGTMISALMIYTGISKTANEAMELFGRIRCNDSKGVTIPSQKRYVNYFEECVVHKGMKFPKKDSKVILKGIYMNKVPHFDRDLGSDPYFVIHIPNYDLNHLDNYRLDKLYDYSDNNKVKHFKKEDEVYIKNLNIELSGDMKFTFYDLDKLHKDDKMFTCWLNTNFLYLHEPIQNCNVNNNNLLSSSSNLLLGNSGNNNMIKGYKLEKNEKVVRIPKMELDKAIKDKKHSLFDSDFYIDFIFEMKEPTIYTEEPIPFVYQKQLDTLLQQQSNNNNTTTTTTTINRNEIELQLAKSIFGEIQQFAKINISQKDSEKAKKQLEEGKENFTKKLYVNAITNFSNALLLDKQFEQAHMSRGLAQMNLKKYSEAIYDFTSVLQLLPQKYNYLYINNNSINIISNNLNNSINNTLKIIIL
ncbi:hypothetical protein ABK040_009694 [Willaertia magna]